MNEMPRATPPAFVPTLTEVVRADFADAPASVSPPMALPVEFANLLEGWPSGLNASQPNVTEAAGPAMSLLAPAVLERLLLHVEGSLASQLQEAVERAVDAQMQALKLSLRDRKSVV
jgi:hypothetical protein